MNLRTCIWGQLLKIDGCSSWQNTKLMNCSIYLFLIFSILFLSHTSALVSTRLRLGGGKGIPVTGSFFSCPIGFFIEDWPSVMNITLFVTRSCYKKLLIKYLNLPGLVVSLLDNRLVTLGGNAAVSSFLLLTFFIGVSKLSLFFFWYCKSVSSWERIANAADATAVANSISLES